MARTCCLERSKCRYIGKDSIGEYKVYDCGSIDIGGNNG
jgi:hypothetical protein